jgi:hypothetical protein
MFAAGAEDAGGAVGLDVDRSAEMETGAIITLGKLQSGKWL